MSWSLDEWACCRYPCDSVNQSSRRNCLNCGEAAPADPYFFYHIKASEEEQIVSFCLKILSIIIKHLFVNESVKFLTLFAKLQP